MLIVNIVNKTEDKLVGHMRPIMLLIAVVLLLGGCSSEPREPASAPSNDGGEVALASDPGEALYQQHCAACHGADAAVEAPSRSALSLQPSEAIIAALTSGVMKQQASALTKLEKRLVAEFVGSPTGENALSNAQANRCTGRLQLTSRPLWNRWGNNLRNSRFQTRERAGIGYGNAGKLKLKWAFGIPGGSRARSQPAVTKEALFFGSQSGIVYALNPQTGCIWWTFEAEAEVRNAPTIGIDRNGHPDLLYFGDFNANVYAVEAETGRLVWQKSVRDHPVGTITGSVTHYRGRLYVPMSSTEVVSAFNPDYECCTFRGGLLAIRADDGSKVWRFQTVDEPRKTGQNSAGSDQFGPSGAPIWSTPTIDRKRGLIYVGTGENYSSPANDKSDSIIALDLATGAVRWKQQTVEGDAWNGACGQFGSKVNCPQEDGPDFDFGAPPILTTLANGKDVILAGQKSGMIYAMDPDAAGKILWQARAGMGGFNGGVHWGMATDGKTLFVGIADTPGNRFAVGPPRQGLHAYDAETGKPLWSRLEPNICEEREHKCMTALSAPPTIAGGVIYAGALNGIMRAYSAADGTPLWTTDTRREYKTVNGVVGRGGSIDSSGPVVAGGLLLVNSGYDKFGQIPGNVLLAYEAE